ncbi:hypothetical protein [Nitratifractor sp.]
MKELVEFLRTKGIVCKSLEQVEPRELGSRKRVEIYRGVRMDDYYCMILVLKKKSRVLRKEAEELFELHTRLSERIGATIRYRYLLLDAPICSKAAALLEERGWRIFRLT